MDRFLSDIQDRREHALHYPSPAYVRSVRKIYYHHTGYPGGLRSTDYRTLLATKPEFAVYESIRRMMPKGPLGRKMLTKLRIYAGPDHDRHEKIPDRSGLCVRRS